MSSTQNSGLGLGAGIGITTLIFIIVGVLIWYFMLRPKNGDKCHPKDEDRVDGATIYTLKGKKCTPNACASGFTFVATSNTCVKDIIPDPIIPGTACDSYTGTQSADGALTFKIGNSRNCDEIASCDTDNGYILLNGSCVKDEDTCIPYEWQGASAGTAIVIDGTVGICKPVSPTDDSAGNVWSGREVVDGIVRKYYNVPAAGNALSRGSEPVPNDYTSFENNKCGLADKVYKGAYTITSGTDPFHAANICAETYCTDASCKGIVYTDNVDGKANCFVLRTDSEAETSGEVYNGAICLVKD